jgi:superfamily I DNA/RNA helicase
VETEKVKLVPTEEQLAVIDAVAEPASSVMVPSLAGCSKSTTLEMAAPRVKVPALALAFNKRIAVELGPRLPGNFSTKTINSFGFDALRRAFPQVGKWDLDGKKLGKLVSQVAKDRDVDLSSEQWDQLRQLVSAAMQAGLVPRNEGRGLVSDSLETWKDLADGLWIPREDFEFLYDLAREVLEKNNSEVKKGKISFDDQIYYSTCVAGAFPQFPVVFVDEAQDLSSLNHQMLARGLRPDGRLIVVGDPKQAIYSFRGAHAKSMQAMRGLRPSWLDRELTTTFRCPKAIVARQQEHAPGYRAWHTNPEGRVLRTPTLSEGGEGWSWSTIQEMLPAPSASLMVLCRNNGPLLSLAFKLLRSQVGVVMLGRDIGKNLISLSRKLLPKNDIPLDLCIGRIRNWIASESFLALANGAEEKVEGIEDRGECLVAVLESGCRDAGELRQMLTKLFSRESGQVELSSIHKAKGLERDLILFLDPWRIPSKFAREAAKRGDPSQMEQEMNLRYVAETRTRHTLVLANLEDYNA